MASYDLRCAECGHDFEIFVQGFLKDDSKVCPECGSCSVDQRFTGFLVASSGRSSDAGPSIGHSCGSGSFG